MCRISSKKLASDRGWCLLALGGLGAPHWNSDVRTAFYGLGPATTRADLVRAAMEAVAFLFKDIEQAAQKAYGLNSEPIRVAGGASRLDYLLQFQADILRRPLARSKVLEASALGAAYLAGWQTGLMIPSLLSRLFSPEKVFRPGRSAESESFYLSWQEKLRFLVSN